MYSNHQQDDWVNWLPLAEFTYNNILHEATGCTPFFLNKGQHPRTLPTDKLTNPKVLADAYLQAIQAATHKAESCLSKAKEAMKQSWDRKQVSSQGYKVGDLVLVSSKHLPSN
jgi:hypothetical protein